MMRASTGAQKPMAPREKGPQLEEDEVAAASNLENAEAKLEMGLSLMRERRAKSRESGLTIVRQALEESYNADIIDAK